MRVHTDNRCMPALPISNEELASLTADEVQWLLKNTFEGDAINSSFCRSALYPGPRDLCFPMERKRLAHWAKGKTSIVEIGVFEGASALTLRRAMAPSGVLHLIDPFLQIPDSGLTARPWMAKLNVSRSRNGTIKWYRDYSSKVALRWANPIDLLFIDGDHSENACLEDWNSWHTFVPVGGVVIFHDARFMKGDGQYWDGWPGPTHVVDKLFRNSGRLTNWDIVDEMQTLVAVQRRS